MIVKPTKTGPSLPINHGEDPLVRDADAGQKPVARKNPPLPPLFPAGTDKTLFHPNGGVGI